jgi:hypothetical protein
MTTIKKAKEHHLSIVKPRKVDPEILLGKIKSHELDVRCKKYPDVELRIDVHAADHALVLFGIENSFRGKSIDDCQKLVPTLTIGDFQFGWRREDLITKDAGLDFAVLFLGKSINQIGAQITQYLDALAR